MRHSSFLLFALFQLPGEFENGHLDGLPLALFSSARWLSYVGPSAGGMLQLGGLNIVDGAILESCVEQLPDI